MADSPKLYRVNYGLCWCLMNPSCFNPFSISIGAIVEYLGERNIAGQQVVDLRMNAVDFWITKQNFEMALVRIR